jgi:outer membrane scaffolding protein for murein synthesis (MipA/OmpV family)
MKTLSVPVLLLSLVAAHAQAQTPAANPMPDGSRDMYVGLGVLAQPRYQGADDHRTRALPLLQVQWSSGLFVSGMSAGWHLSPSQTVEAGPLLALEPGRDSSGRGGSLGDVDVIGTGLVPAAPTGVATTGNEKIRLASVNRLSGMKEHGPRLQAGGFLNVYLSPDWRVTQTLLYGGGIERNALRWDIGVQRLARDLGAHHRVSVGAGLLLANRAGMHSDFGVTEEEARVSYNRAFAPRAGVQEAYLGLRWHWSLTPDWMLTSSARLARLQGDARRSPLVERPTQFTISTGLVRRF